jgi:hypothetical protein
MGIDTEFRSIIRAELAPSAFHKGAMRVPNHVFICDLLSYIVNAAVGPNFNYMYTGLQLYQELMRIVKLQWDNGAAVVIIVCDDQDGVPVQKAATQAKRSSVSTHEPYDTSKQSYKITTRGLSSDGVSDEMFDIRRLFRTRALRKPVCEFLASMLKEEVLAHGKAIVLHYQQQPVVIWSETGCEEFDFTYTGRTFGEADLACMQWAYQFQNHDVVYFTTDTDFMPLFANFYDKTGGDKRTKAFYWVYECEFLSRSREKRESALWVDATSMIRQTLAELNMTPHAFMMMCILGGTDFFDKKSILTQIGPKRTLTAIKNYSATRSSLDEFGKHTETDDMHALMVFLYAVYAGPIKKFPVMGLYCYDTPKDLDPAPVTHRLMKWDTFHSAVSLRLTKSYKPPTEVTLRQQQPMLLWNLKYWKNSLDGAPSTAKTSPKRKAVENKTSKQEEGAPAGSSFDKVDEQDEKPQHTKPPVKKLKFQTQ